MTAYAVWVRVRAVTEGVIKGMKGEDVTMCSFVESSVTELPFFASPCKFGPEGVKEV